MLKSVENNFYKETDSRQFNIAPTLNINFFLSKTFFHAFKVFKRNELLN